MNLLSGLNAFVLLNILRFTSCQTRRQLNQNDDVDDSGQDNDNSGSDGVSMGALQREFKQLKQKTETDIATLTTELRETQRKLVHTERLLATNRQELDTMKADNVNLQSTIKLAEESCNVSVRGLKKQVETEYKLITKLTEGLRKEAVRDLVQRHNADLVRIEEFIHKLIDKVQKDGKALQKKSELSMKRDVDSKLEHLRFSGYHAVAASSCSAHLKRDNYRGSVGRVYPVEAGLPCKDVCSRYKMRCTGNVNAWMKFRRATNDTMPQGHSTTSPQHNSHVAYTYQYDNCNWRQWKSDSSELTSQNPASLNTFAYCCCTASK